MTERSGLAYPCSSSSVVSKQARQALGRLTYRVHSLNLTYHTMSPAVIAAGNAINPRGYLADTANVSEDIQTDQSDEQEPGTSLLQVVIVVLFLAAMAALSSPQPAF